jgi:putative glutathione S-transferase
VQSTDDTGGFVRQAAGFRNWITPDGAAGPTGEGGFKAEADRYHLFVALICPWACRTLIARNLKRLTFISVTVLEPAVTDQGWRFADGPDPARWGAAYLHEIYTRATPDYTGRATVPVLWDKTRNTIVNNESADIVRMFNTAFGDLADPSIDLCPAHLQGGIDALNQRIYRQLNNGVYRAGFATTQLAYESAFGDVFDMLDELEVRLAVGPFLFGECLTESDVRLFVTLIRFDAAYHGLFKCNLRQLLDYKNLSAYVIRLLAIPGFRQTVSIDHIKRGYYSIRALNPNGIVPVGPALDAYPINAYTASPPLS